MNYKGTKECRNGSCNEKGVIYVTISDNGVMIDYLTKIPYCRKHYGIHMDAFSRRESYQIVEHGVLSK